jgi:rhodanese-related sulfurtransferase
MDIVSVETLDALKKEGRPLCVLDVREPWECAIVSIEGSVCVPLAQLPVHLEQLKQYQHMHVVTVCHHGVRSQRAAAFLLSAGFTQVSSLEGGVDAWAVSIDPSLPRY